jgi:putative permease
MKRLMTYTAVILATLTVMFILWQFSIVILLFFLSLFVAASIRPLVMGLARRGLSEVLAQLMLFVLGFGVFVLGIFLVGDLLLQETNIAANRGVLEYESLHSRWQEGSALQQMAIEYLPPPFDLAAAQDAELEDMLPLAMTVTRGLTGLLGGLLLVLALSVYWSVDQNRFERLWLSLLPARRRAYTRDSWREIENSVGSYLRSQFAQSVLVAIFLATGAALGGFSYPLLLAFFGALAAFIPLFGGLLTALFAFILGSFASYWMGVGAAVFTLIVFLGLELFIEPRLWTRDRRNFMLTILVVIPMYQTFGIFGLIAAPPLAAALEVLIQQAFRVRVASRDTVIRLEELENRFERLAKKIAQSENEVISPEIHNLTAKLANLLVDSKTLTSSQER